MIIDYGLGTGNCEQGQSPKERYLLRFAFYLFHPSIKLRASFCLEGVLTDLGRLPDGAEMTGKNCGSIFGRNAFLDK